MSTDIQKSKITEFLIKCDSFITRINQNAIWNLNDGINALEYIQNNDTEWVIFVNKVTTYFKLYPCNEFEQEFKSITEKNIFTSSELEKIKILFNTMLDQVDLMNTENCSKIQEITKSIQKIDEIEKLFHTVGGNGIPQISQIHDCSEFLIWKEKISTELIKLKQDETIVKIRNIFNDFNGWNDKQKFKELKAKLIVLNENLDDYLINQENEVLNMDNNKIFIVHGHDNEVRNNVELFIHRIGLNPIILSERASKGMTIIEKIEANSDVSFALVLYTRCDEGRLKGIGDLQDRARQNVVFEHGFMAAHLGRQNVVALVEDGIEIPGDLSGIVYISLANTDWKKQVMREFEAAHLKFDWGKA